MATDIANITLTGRLGGDPDVKEKFTTFTLASNYWDGKEEQTSWRRIKDLSKGHEKRAEFMSKGSKVTISGSEAIEEWTDKDGGKRTSAVVIARDIVFPPKADGERTQRNERQPARQESAPRKASNFADDFADDDIPF